MVYVTNLRKRSEELLKSW